MTPHELAEKIFRICCPSPGTLHSFKLREDFNQIKEVEALLSGWEKELLDIGYSHSRHMQKAAFEECAKIAELAGSPGCMLCNGITVKIRQCAEALK